MTDESVFETQTEQGRQAYRDGVSKDDCPFMPVDGRAYTGWINGWSQEFGKTPEAVRNEAASRREAKKIKTAA